MLSAAGAARNRLRISLSGRLLRTCGELLSLAGPWNALASLLAAAANGIALPYMRRDTMRPFAGAWRLDRGLPAKPPYLRLLLRYPVCKLLRRCRFILPAATLASSQTAIGCQTCPERHDYSRSDSELDLSARSPLTAAARRQQKSG
jgi:hypothetical protein